MLNFDLVAQTVSNVCIKLKYTQTNQKIITVSHINREIYVSLGLRKKSKEDYQRGQGHPVQAHL